MADRLIFIRVEHELLLARNCQKRKQMTARERSDESLLGIDIGGIAEIGRGRRCGHRMAAVEAPDVIARIFLIRKLGAAAFPFQSRFVLGHAFVSLCARTCLCIKGACARRNCGSASPARSFRAAVPGCRSITSPTSWTSQSAI